MLGVLIIPVILLVAYLAGLGAFKIQQQRGFRSPLVTGVIFFLAVATLLFAFVLVFYSGCR